jgi:hypothetical protein
MTSRLTAHGTNPSSTPRNSIAESLDIYFTRHFGMKLK